VRRNPRRHQTATSPNWRVWRQPTVERECGARCLARILWVCDLCSQLLAWTCAVPPVPRCPDRVEGYHGAAGPGEPTLQKSGAKSGGDPGQGLVAWGRAIFDIVFSIIFSLVVLLRARRGREPVTRLFDRDPNWNWNFGISQSRDMPDLQTRRRGSARQERSG